MKILLVGGGSGGPVAPLLAVAQSIKARHPKTEFLLVGTKRGPEKLMAEQAGIHFQSIPAGKFRRYFSWKNLFSPFFILAGFVKSLYLLRKYRPDCIFGAGSFVQVPAVWAGWLLKIPVVIHQQDLIPSLANSLCQLAAQKITVSFRDSVKDFSSVSGIFYKKNADKVSFTGNPCRLRLTNWPREKALEFFHLRKDFPTLLVLGGGTGASFLNDLILKTLPSLSKSLQIIHSTGRGKFKAKKSPHYVPFEFINDMDKAYAAADLVLCRAGMSTLTELSRFRKISIVIPLPKTHQEANAAYFFVEKAAVVLDQTQINGERFLQIVKKILFSVSLQETLKTNIGALMPKDSAEKIAQILIQAGTS